MACAPAPESGLECALGKLRRPDSDFRRAIAVDFDGGADVRFAPFLAWRLAEDDLNAPTSTPSQGSHDRFTTGLVLQF